MDHVAILSAKFHYIDMILAETKTIESRWYVNRTAPWDKVFAGETVYFKDSGKPVSAHAQVSQVLQYDNLDYPKVMSIYKEYGVEIGNKPADFEKYALGKEKKNYCILVFLEKPKSIPSFNIDKTGFGISSAWMCVGDVDKVRV